MKINFKSALGGDMLVPWRVSQNWIAHHQALHLGEVSEFESSAIRGGFAMAKVAGGQKDRVVEAVENTSAKKQWNVKFLPEK